MNAVRPFEKVSIRPGVSVLSVLRHLNYKAWFALAEFVDNSLQSYLSNKDTLEEIHGKSFKLRVEIVIESTDPPRIIVRDNAAGIQHADFPRAFKPAAIPPDRNGLSEFGMGMKSAACWFASKWTVRTKALGDDSEKSIHFDISRIVYDQLEELDVSQRAVSPNLHYTEIILEGLHHVPVRKTVSKIKEHLTDIYRGFIRNEILELRFNNEILVPDTPSILNAPYVRQPDAGPRVWKKEINFDLGCGLKVHGFAALRDPGNFSRAGFALFRRGRLIQGSGDEGYRPPLIFGQPGSFRSLRLFGELHLEGFDVAHTKDGFRWDENEAPFLDLLKEHLDSDELPLLRQADGYRALAAKVERETAAREAVQRTASALEQNLPTALEKVAEQAPTETSATPLEAQNLLASKEISFKFRDERWRIKVEFSDDPSESEWLSFSDVNTSERENFLEIRISIRHPFIISFAQASSEQLEMLMRLGAGLAVSESLARRVGVKYAGTVRRNLNELLKDALSKPSV